MILNRLVSHTRSIVSYHLRSKSIFPAADVGNSVINRTFSSLGGDDSSSVDYKLIEFATLHELQESACQTFSSNDLFGTYSPATEKFEFITYSDVGREIERCRSLLQSMGKL
jgi:hypothetical protein